VNYWRIIPQVVLGVVVAAMLSVSSAQATTYFVKGATGNDTNSGTKPSKPLKTIGAALNKAVSGDTIKVAAGQYIGPIIIAKNNVSLLGGWNATFSVQSPSSYPARISAAEFVTEALAFGNTLNSLLDGFFIDGNQLYGYHGITVGSLGSARISRNIISSCGNGIVAYGHAILEANVVQGSNIDGVIVRSPDSSKRTIIANNYVHSNGRWGIWVVGYANGSDLMNNIVVNNLVGVSVGYTVQQTGLYNNTIMNNMDGGVLFAGQSPLDCKNNNIAFNGSYGIRNDGSSSVLGDNNNFHGHTNDYVNLVALPFDISVDPLVDSGFNLGINSLCVDAGVDLSEVSTYLQRDFNGDPRTITLGGDGLFDLGAQEQ